MPELPGTLDKNSERYLESSLASGSAILFTGAGFSRGARNRSNEPLPSGAELAEDLWQIAFPGEPFDPRSALGDIFDVARRSAGNATKRLLEQKLSVVKDTVADYYKDYLSLPWFKIYTLNLDDLIPRAASKFNLPDEIASVAALRPASASGLTAVHLNGMVSHYPDVTFSAPQFGARTAGADPFYEVLARDLYAHPVIFIGTLLDEPPLWHHLALRGDRPSISELRPKSFLVSPSLPVARRAMLQRYNVKWIAMDTEVFCSTYITPALKSVSVPRPSAILRAPIFEDVAVARGTPIPDLADFLLGREPQWADVAQGFAIARTCEESIGPILSRGDIRALIVTGTAGTGKSTVLRRVALSLQAQGKRVLWLRADAPGTMTEIRGTALAEDSAAVVFVDDVQRFRQRGVDLVRSIAEADSAPLVVVALHSTSYEELQVAKSLYGLRFENVVVPNLDDDEIDDLIASLARANRLGEMTGMTDSQRKSEFKSRSHRQLLVAMLEATSGRRFEEKIELECRSLPPDLTLAYVTAVVATVNSYALPPDVLLAALSDYSSEGLAIIDRLRRQHLLLTLSDGRLTARHRVIAREAVSYYRSAGQLIDGFERLAFALASRVSLADRTSAERRLLTRLINHMSVHAASDSRARVREMYEQLEPLLKTDAHYWLQRGAYEVERGDASLAENFLGSARSLASNDFMIETEWAYLMLQRACDNPGDPLARTWVTDAHDILFEIISSRGATSPNTYVVLAQKTILWCSKGSLLLREKIDILQAVRGAMKAGARWHSSNNQFSAAAADLEHAYLSLSLG